MAENSYFKSKLEKLIGKPISIWISDSGVHISNYTLSFDSETTSINYDIIESVSDTYFTYKQYTHESGDWEYARYKYGSSIPIDKISVLGEFHATTIESVLSDIKRNIEIYAKMDKEREERDRQFKNEENQRNAKTEAKKKQDKLILFLSVFAVFLFIAWLVFGYFFGAPFWIPFLIALFLSSGTLMA